MGNELLFKADKTGIYLGDKLVITVWGAEWTVIADREDGESWLDMRERTRKFKLAEEVAGYLNSPKGLKLFEEQFKLEE